MRSAKKHPMVVLGGKYITEEASALAADIAVLLGKSDGPRRGVFRVEQKNNSKALGLLGVTQTPEVLDNAKGIMIFGEDPNADLSGYDFIMVQDTHLTLAAQKADVVLPALAFPEVAGTFINTEGRMQRVTPAVSRALPYTNIGMVVEIGKILGEKPGSTCTGLIRRTLQAEIPELMNVEIGSQIHSGRCEGSSFAKIRRSAIRIIISVKGAYTSFSMGLSDMKLPMIFSR